MKNTFDPQLIYEIFDKNGFQVCRIDDFDSGNFAKVRADLAYEDYLSIKELQDIVVKLSFIEKEENIRIKIVNIDMYHKSLRINIYIDENEYRLEHQ